MDRRVEEPPGGEGGPSVWRVEPVSPSRSVQKSVASLPEFLPESLVSHSGCPGQAQAGSLPDLAPDRIRGCFAGMLLSRVQQLPLLGPPGIATIPTATGWFMPIWSGVQVDLDELVWDGQCAASRS